MGKTIDRTGEKGVNNFGSKMVIKEYRKYSDIDVYFQEYGQWFDDNYYEIKGERMALDKDILVKHNKIYSPETCIFVPQTINCMWHKNTGL